MHHPGKLGEDKTDYTENLDTGPAPKTLTRSWCDPTPMPMVLHQHPRLCLGELTTKDNN